MKIAIISDGFPPQSGGGVATAHYNLYNMLQREGYDVRAFTFRDKLRKDDVVVRRGPNFLARILVRIFASIFFRACGRKGKGTAYQFADVLLSYAAFWIYFDLKKFKPDVVVLPDQGAPAFFLRKPDNCAFVLVCHHNPSRWLDNPLLGEHCAFDARMAMAVEKKGLAKIDLAVCPSAYMQGVFEGTYGRDLPVETAPNIADLAYIRGIAARDARRELSLPGDAKMVYVPSAGSPLKGAEYVFEIVRRIQRNHKGDVGFFLSGPVPDKLWAQLDTIEPKPKILAPGLIPNRENIAWLKSCDLCASPTLIENYSMSLVEAVCCGLPVVSFDVGGNSEIPGLAEEGGLVRLLDLEGFIELCLEILARPKQESGRERTFQVDPGFSTYLRILERARDMARASRDGASDVPANNSSNNTASSD